MTKFDQFVHRKVNEYGSGFDGSALSRQFIQYYNSGERIKVDIGLDRPYCGTVGVTTGWRPAFLLMQRCTSYSSWILLSDSSKVLAVKHGNKYREVNEKGTAVNGFYQSNPLLLPAA